MHWQEGAPNYYPNSFNGPADSTNYNESRVIEATPDVARFNSADEDNFTQAGIFYRDVSLFLIFLRLE